MEDLFRAGRGVAGGEERGLGRARADGGGDDGTAERNRFTHADRVAVGERGAHEEIGGGDDGERAMALELAQVMDGAAKAAGARGGGERGGARAGAVDDEAGVGDPRAHLAEGVEQDGGAVLGAGGERAGDEQRMRTANLREARR